MTPSIDVTGSNGFQQLVDRAVDVGGFGADDAINAVLPLFDDAEALHDQGDVASLRGIGALVVDDQHRVHLADGSARSPLMNHGKLAEVQPAPGYLDVVSETRRLTDLTGPDAASIETPLDLIEPGEPFSRPVLVVGWQSWEHLVDHHDQLTDIFSIGLVFAALALGLDFAERAAVERFAANRTNLFRLKTDLHPIVAQVITQMTDPDRRTRGQDLESIEQRLRTYRDQPVDFDLDRLAGARAGPVRTRRTVIQAALRDQLFDLSRRNRLVHFRPTQQSLNLTLASVPLLLDVRNITAAQLFVWQPPLIDKVVGRRTIVLSSLLRFEDAPYIPGSLDKLISTTRRTRAEYGIAQLRLVVCFLRWHNLKEAKDERIHSPLLLLPVELAKKRGVRDSYTLQATTTEAEVNPAVRQYLKQLYGLDLPETVDLETTTIDQFHQQLEAMIKASEPAVDLLKVDRPQIDLVHHKARLRLDQYQRRRGAVRPRAAAPRHVASVSYEHRDLEPRGLELYLRQVRPSPLPLSAIAGGPPGTRSPQLAATADAPPGACAPAVVERDATAYRLTDAATGNPYRWELDLCAMTLANFSYRNMTLVRDYNQLVDTDQSCAAFDQIFSLEAKPVTAPDGGPLPLREQHLVVAADATQVATIARARLGGSFIIQGPPGTGKSQTITNLIADYAFLGKRVLFVCEKRAAIDVVHARLRQQGLDELCSLIHDSQADKKTFIHGLKQTYEAWLAEPEAFGGAEADREQVLTRMEAALGALEHFDRAMVTPASGPGTSLRELYERAIGLAPDRFDPDPLVTEQLPDIADWFAHRPALDRLAVALASAGEEPILALHPLRWLGAGVLASDQPLDAVTRQADDASSRLTDLASRIVRADLDPAGLTLDDAESLVGFASATGFLTDHGLIGVLDPGSPTSADLTARASRWTDALHVRDATAAHAASWREPLLPGDARIALALAQQQEPRALKFLSGAWRSLRKTVHARYDFAAHAVMPSITAVLTDLVAAQDSQAALEALTTEAWSVYGASDYRPFVDAVTAWRTDARPAIVALRSRLLTGDTVGRAALAEAAPSLPALRTTLSMLLADGHDQGLEELQSTVAGIRSTTGLLADLLEPLRRLAEAPPAVSDAVRRLPVAIASIEYAITVATINRAYRADRTVERFDSRHLEELLAQLHTDFISLLELNGRAVRQRARARFTANVAISATSATQLTAEQKVRKKSYSAGRRELEHEFAKTMRYKSIRDLASGESGQVLLDLRPIWLMSPLSVSDALPLDPEQFDVVIFDEASQVPLEEAIPALYRAHQVVIVGDQMQLPPTQFFAGAAKGRDAEGDIDVDLDPDPADEHRIGVTLDSDSFLAQSDTSLPSTMLAWHYRSRSEALIGFSNAAFYGGRLATIPDRTVPASSTRAERVEPAESGDPTTGVDAVLARSISVHHLPNAVYEARRNVAEAEHIAGLVRELLARRTGHTIGVVAFSEAQQTAIEDALERLATSDPTFATSYEEEQIREEDGQFVGLFVKNLENVQGDERDIVIMSVCYGPGPDGRMLMNFGPINQRGGEKRLNVIFSRAKHHMAIVTTIGHTAITNEYNDGANTLRRFLQYAEAVSQGDQDAARRVLLAVDLEHDARTRELRPATAVIAALAAALAARGYEVAVDLGESAFTCDLAIRRPADDHYRLGVLVDTDHRTRAAPTLERAVAHPYVLAEFGWSIAHVTTKDWFHQPDRVLADLERRLAGPT